MKPSFPFYPDDWLNDLGLRRCCAATRGIWIDLCRLAHQGEPYGCLRKAGADLSVKYMASRCTVTPRELARAIQELEENNVFSRTEAGAGKSRIPRQVATSPRHLVTTFPMRAGSGQYEKEKLCLKAKAKAAAK